MSAKLLSLTIAAACLLPAAGGFAPHARAGFPGHANGKIAFVHVDSEDVDSDVDSQGDEEIRTVDRKLGGSPVVDLTNNTKSDRTPAWSPNGMRVAFASDRNGQLDIYTMNRNGGDVRRLTTSPAADTDPAWSPDGKKIVFSSNRAEGNTDLYVMYANGSNQTRLTKYWGADEHPSWGAGGRIAFENNFGGDDDIFTIKPDGNGLVTVTDNTFDDRWPNWSPNGSRIAYASDADSAGYFDIYTVDPNGDNQARLTDKPAYDSQPAWSPLGTGIAFVSDRNGPYQVFVMDAQGNGEQKVLDAQATNPDWQPVVPTFMQSAKNVKVKPHGTYAIVSWDQRVESDRAHMELWQGKKGQPGSKVGFRAKTTSAPTKHWEIKVTGLEPGTTFDELYIVMFDVEGKLVPYKHPSAVQTLRRDVWVTFHAMTVYNDGDPLAGDCGDFLFEFLVGDVLIFDRGPGICDVSDWDAPDLTIKLEDVKSDAIVLRALAVDDDQVPVGSGLDEFVDEPANFGDTKVRGEWGEGSKTIDVSAKDFTIFGENYSKLAQTLLVHGCSGCPHVKWYFNYEVKHQ